MNYKEGEKIKQQTEEGNNLAKFIANFIQIVMFDFPLGPKICKMRHIINIQKGGTFFWCCFLIWYYQNFSFGAILYLCLHGSYGYVWLLKDFTFPDKQWEQEASIVSLIGGSGYLMLYEVLPFLLISGKGIQDPSIARVFCAITTFCLGVVIMIAADCQKYFTLKFKPGQLISDGMFKYSRNPNYFGEVLIYGSFAVVVGLYEGWIIVLIAFLIFFPMTMTKKDLSLSKKKGWLQYSQRSWMFFFKFFENEAISYLFWIAIAGIFYLQYFQKIPFQFLRSQ